MKAETFSVESLRKDTKPQYFPNKAVR
jgi:hypothetical protein